MRQQKTHFGMLLWMAVCIVGALLYGVTIAWVVEAFRREKKPQPTLVPEV